MTRDELSDLDTDDGAVITAGQLRSIQTLGEMLASGTPPRGQSCFNWGKLLQSIVESADPLQEN